MAKGELSKAFVAALARPVLNRLATIPVFQQGQELCLQRQFANLTVDADEAAANVGEYLARLWMEDGFLQYECGCERGAQGLLCMHGVTVALAAIEPKTAAGKTKAKPKTIDMAQTDKILREQSSETLAGLLLHWAQQDDRLMQHLMTFAAQQGGYALDIKAYRASLKKRLKRPSRSASVTECRRYAKLVDKELESLAALNEQGQAFATLELASEILMLMFSFNDYDSNGTHLILEKIAPSFALFLEAARRSRAEAKVLIPHVLRFHEYDVDAKVHDFGQVFALLGPDGSEALARAADALVEPKSPHWERRARSLRYLRLAEQHYVAKGDFDAYERMVMKYARDFPHEMVGPLQRLLASGEYQRVIRMIEGARHEGREPLRDFYWLGAEAQMRLGDPAAALQSFLPGIEQQTSAGSFSLLRSFADEHKCWPAWREMLLKLDPPRPRWVFHLHLSERNYAAAWPIALSHRMGAQVTCLCAFEMRLTDPENALRMIVDNAEPLFEDGRTMLAAFEYLDAAAVMVVEQGLRPAGLAELMHSVMSRFALYGQSQLTRIREPLWREAAGLLKPSLVFGRGRRI